MQPTNGSQDTVEFLSELLEKKESQFRTLVESSPVAMVISRGLEQKVEYYNPRFTELFGYTLEDAPDVQHWWPLAYPDEAYRKEISELWNQQVERARATGGQTEAIEAMVTCKDGSQRYVEFKLVHAGERNLVFGIDLTQRKLVERAMRNSEQRYRTLFERNVAGVAIIGVDGILVDCNDAWARIFGHHKAGECRGAQILNCYSNPAERQVLLDELEKHGTFSNRELQLRRPDGTLFWILLNSVLVKDEPGGPLIQSTIIDISDWKATSDKIRASEQSFRALVERSPDTIVRYDLECRRTYINPKMQAFFPSNDALGKVPGEDSPLLNVTAFVDLLKEVIRTGEEREMEMPSRSTTGEMRWLRLRVLPEFDANGKVISVLGVGHDIHEIRTSEQRFRMALKDSPVTVFNQNRDLQFTWIYNPPSEWPTVVVGKTCDDVLGAKNAVAINELKRQALETEKGVRGEVRIQFNGTRKALDVAVEPLRDASGAIVGITGSLTDVARLRELADRLESQREKLLQEKSYLQNEIQSELGFEEIVGQSANLREVLGKVKVVAPTDSTVLILGETGTGKELVARAVHALSPRSKKNFIKLNCAAVPSGLLESELFGHEKGAFTGAVTQKMGRLELADEGTLFLDEVGDLPLELQPKLLRVLQDHEFERLGGIRTMRVNVRLITATNQELQKEVANKRFREDLFYRLNVFPVSLPPLRMRRDDIPMLIQHFVHKHSTHMAKHIEIIPEQTMTVLQRWSWPGNVRELENMIERMVILTNGKTLASPPAELDELWDDGGDNLEVAERGHIVRILRETKGIVAGTRGAAVRLGVSRTTLQSMVKRLGIEPHEYLPATGTFPRR